MTDQRTAMSPEGMDLFARLMEQNVRDAAYTTNALLEGYRRRADRAEATLDAIRYRMGVLFSGDYMPAEHAIMRALNPSDELIDRFMPREEAN